MNKEYSNSEIIIKWQPKLCQHSGICVKTLPQVYKPKESPWITIENASTEELKAQVSRCPSGALTYTLVIKGDEG
ncbi:MAG: (4Fe-4S)-binding protein [Daejeonella sp.]|uniref:(4Fe-4S)-binding protein n=1 Tax=Daejeonella sp. TaxID=2805397 RepID=UPI002733FF25|nr:(4Fe-4S)-binding protein [Daejeonella sp.]MDP3469099.1 (4Fe-4S)-binding protein [Daejeonella sp.]